MTTTQETIEDKVLRGNAYTTARGVTVASGNSASVAVENPSDSSKVLVIDTQEVYCDSAASGTYYRSPDISSASDASAANDLIGSSNTTVANVYHDGSYSNADSTTNFPLSESGANEAGFARRPPIALQPGESIVVEVDSDGADNDILFIFTFYETARGMDN